MNYKRSAMLIVGAVLSASVLSHAAPPAKSAISPVSPVRPVAPKSSKPEPSRPNKPNTVITPSGLAVADSVISYCSHIDRSAAADYGMEITMVTQGHPAGEIAAVRGTAEYIQTQATLNAQLAKVALGNGMLACREFIGTNHKPFGVASPIHALQFGPL